MEGYKRVLNDIKVGDVLSKNNIVLAKIDADYELRIYIVLWCRSHRFAFS